MLHRTKKSIYNPYERFTRDSERKTKMLKKIFTWFNLDYQNTLDAYIASRNPQNQADVERFERQFERLCRSCYF